MCNRSKKIAVFSQRNATFFKKNGVSSEKNGDFFGENEDFENQPFVKADFLLENPLDNSPFQQNNSAFYFAKTPSYPTKTAFCERKKHHV